MKFTTNLSLKKPDGTDNVNIADFNENADKIDAEITRKASQTQDGRLSKEDYSKLLGIETGAQKNAVTSVAGKTGAVTLAGTDVPAATTAARGTVQLSTATNSTSTTLAATPSAVKSAMDKANAAETPAGAQAKVDALAGVGNTKTVKQVADDVAEHLADGAAHGIGDKTTLKTTNKTTIVAALNELFTNANDGKTAIANAVTAKGVTASPSDTFPTLANKIGQINSSNISSIQSGQLSWSSTGSTTITINSVDLNKSIVLISVSSVTGTNAQDITVTARLSSATQITLDRYNSSGTIIVAWQVIEFESLKSLQTGYFATTTSPRVITVTPVDVSKSLLIFSSSTTAATTDIRQVFISGRLSSNTELTFNKGQSNEHRVRWQLVEFA